MKKYFFGLLIWIFALTSYSQVNASQATKQICQSNFWKYAVVASNWNCDCMSWYVPNSSQNSCVLAPVTKKATKPTPTQICQNSFWKYVVASKNWGCECMSWYIPNSSKSSCVLAPTLDQICKQAYWENSIGWKSKTCYCKSWYEWNSLKTSCISTYVPVESKYNFSIDENYDSEDCDIKWNISYNSGEKIYHVPGWEYYDATVINTSYGERWFCSEEEAEDAGWRRSRR